MLKALVARLARGQAGSATIEIAILTPLLLLLVLGAADFARVYRVHITAVGAAEAGAQYESRTKLMAGDISGMIAATTRDASDLDAVTATARRFCECGGVAASCTSSCADGHAPEVYVEVTVSTSYRTAVRYPGIPSDIPLGHIATMRVE